MIHIHLAKRYLYSVSRVPLENLTNECEHSHAKGTLPIAKVVVADTGYATNWLLQGYHCLLAGERFASVLHLLRLSGKSALCSPLIKRVKYLD